MYMYEEIQREASSLKMLKDSQDQQCQSLKAAGL